MRNEPAGVATSKTVRSAEYLDNLMSGALRKRVVPIVEDSPIEEKVRRGNVFLKSQPDKAMPLAKVVDAAFNFKAGIPGIEPGLEATAVYDPPNFSWPSGAHAAVVEVDTETGDARLLRYVAVDDVGAPVNPMVIDGQVHGGVAQAIAAALYEEGVYDEDGNLLTQNLTTYLMPSAAELPSFEVARTETTSPTNPLGVRAGVALEAWWARLAVVALPRAPGSRGGPIDPARPGRVQGLSVAVQRRRLDAELVRQADLPHEAISEHVRAETEDVLEQHGDWRDTGPAHEVFATAPLPQLVRRVMLPDRTTASE